MNEHLYTQDDAGRFVPLSVSITKEIKAPPWPSENPREVFISRDFDAGFVKIAFLGNGKDAGSEQTVTLDLNAEQARYAAYLLVQAADLIEGRVTSLASDSYAIRLDPKLRCE